MSVSRSLFAASLPIALMACSVAEDRSEAETDAANVNAGAAEINVAPEAAPKPDEAQVKAKVPECASSETTAFSCQVAGGKQLSICVTGDPAIAEYRFGKPGSPVELAIAGGPDGDKPTTSRVPYSGGGEAQARFANGATGYVVFSRIVRTRFDGQGNEPAFSAGVMVERGGELLAEVKCAKPIDAALDVAKLEAVTIIDDEAFFIPD